MSQQTYPVACACGKVHQCPAGYAGSRFGCQCGKAVEVPSLSELRSAVHRLPRSVRRSAAHSFDPELEIGSRFRRGQLPVETACVFCREPTVNAVPVKVVCERAEYGSMAWWLLLIPPLTPIGMMVLLVRSQQETGRDVGFELPVRVCDDCQPAVFIETGAVDALRASPLYARLLQQYPNAAVSPAGTPGTEHRPGAMARERSRRTLSRVCGGVAAVVAAPGLLAGLGSLGSWAGEGLPRDGRWWVWVGFLTLAVAVAVLVGYGVHRAVAGIHRHFSPDEID